MTTPYGHIGYFHHSTTEDDESDGISSLDTDNAHPPINSAPSMDEESVGSGITRIKSRVQELETVFSSNLGSNLDGRIAQDEEQRSETTNESANVGTLRKELEDADRIHLLSLADYLKVLDVKPAASGSSSNSERVMTPEPNTDTLPIGDLTWNDLMKATASRSGSVVDNESLCLERDPKLGLLGPSKTMGSQQGDRRPLSRRRNRVLCIALLILLVIGIVVAVVLSTSDSSSSAEKGLSINEVSDAEELSPNNSSDSASNIPVPPSSAGTPKPSESKGSDNIQPSATKAPTTKEPSNLTKAPIIPIEQPQSPTFRPVAVIPPAPVPTGSPGSAALRDEVIGFLEVEYEVDFHGSLSHNIVAVDWLLSEGVGAVNHKLAQRFTLKVLDLSLRGANVRSAGTGIAEKWAELNSDECQWKGVKCNTEGLVTELRLGGRSYGGMIPKEIRILQRSLTFLDLARNELVGPIPEDLFLLTKLVRVYLYQNKLTGVGISPSFANLQNLTHLHMSQNELTGPLPNDLRRMTNLRYLNLYGNRISGRLPHYMKYMSSLWYLDLGRNELTGDLPNGWGEGMISLRHLYLDHNNIDKYIPGSYNKLGGYQLQVLALNDNALTGSVPLKNQNLVTLNVHNNRLGSDLGGDVCAMSIFESGKLVDFSADCDICHCEGSFCDDCTR